MQALTTRKNNVLLHLQALEMTFPTHSCMPQARTVTLRKLDQDTSNTQCLEEASIDHAGRILTRSPLGYQIVFEEAPYRFFQASIVQTLVSPPSLPLWGGTSTR
jgi:hypothetical protein